MEQLYNKHYITIDSNNRITSGFSNAFHQPVETDICINEQGGYQFRLFQGGEENPSLLSYDGIPLYKWQDGTVAVRTAEEIATDKGPDAETLSQIATLKAELSSTDYQIIKCSECSLSNLDAPYDIAALHTSRQAIRDQINALQATLTDTGTTT